MTRESKAARQPPVDHPFFQPANPPWRGPVPGRGGIAARLSSHAEWTRRVASTIDIRFPLSAAMPPPDPSTARPLAAPAPAAPSPESVAPDSPFHLALGFVLLTGCLEAGEFLKRGLDLILPGNILGLFLLLALLGARILPLRRVESAARWLLWLLPLLFMPIFTLALKDRGFWLTQGRAVAGAVAVGTLLLWAFVGHLAQWLLNPPRNGETTAPSAADDQPPRWRETPDAMTGDPTGRGPGRPPCRALCLLPLPGFLGVARWPWDLGPSVLAAVGWSLATVGVYFACRWVFLRTRWPLLHPGLTGILAMVALLECAGRPYPQYERSTEWINWLLGPAVVAMAAPIYQLRAMVRANARVLAVVIPLGLAFAVVSTTLLLAAGGRPRPVVAAGALKSITTPVSYRLAVDAHVSKDAALAGTLIAGMLGATVGPALLGWMRVRDERALGLALGCTSHGIGVARALELGRTGGAFASLGMSGTAMLGALLLPYLLRRLVGVG